MSILITGATGNVGLETIRSLPEDHPVRAGVRTPQRAEGKLPPHVEAVRFDFLDQTTHTPALDGVQRVLLIRPPQLSNVQRDMLPFIRAMQTAEVKQIVFLSVMGAEDVSFIPHAKIEAALRDSGLPWTFLRPGFFDQNLSTTHAADIRDRDTVFVPAGNGRTSFIDVRDIGAVTARTLTEEGHTEQAYTLTGDESLTYHEIATILSDVLGRPIRYAQPNPLHFLWREWRNGTPFPFAVTMTGIYLPTYLNRTGQLTDTT
ncbi:MAG: SDR family oxidoreductase, partial [Chloroflexota bacterium]